MSISSDFLLLKGYDDDDDDDRLYLAIDAYCQSSGQSKTEQVLQEPVDVENAFGRTA